MASLDPSLGPDRTFYTARIAALFLGGKAWSDDVNLRRVDGLRFRDVAGGKPGADDFTKKRLKARCNSGRMV